MNLLKIALLQLSPEKTMDGNRKKGEEGCRKAKEMGADLALFPEMWSTGYTISEDLAALKASAVSSDSDFVCAFGALSRELNMAIGVTFLEAFEPLPKNSFCLFDRFGNKVLSYSKVHTCSFGDECRLTPGDDFYTADLPTQQGSVKVGAMICYDREFPESARILMLKGAEILLVPNACPMEINRITQLRARAFENMVGIATVNYPAEKEDCNGHSTAFDGMAYDQIKGGSRDTCILEAGEKEGIFLAEFPLDELRAYRKSEVWGNAYRRPQKYQLLTQENVREPFIREKANPLKG